MFDSTISLSLPSDHELAKNREDLGKPQNKTGFRSRASKLIETDFAHCFTIREGRRIGALELKVVVPESFLDDFRQRVRSLGFIENDGEDSSPEAAGRKS